VGGLLTECERKTKEQHFRGMNMFPALKKRLRGGGKIIEGYYKFMVVKLLKKFMTGT